MYVIKMERDKSLVTTIRSKIYQGERNADTLLFLIPMYYENVNLADCTMLLRYILPNGAGRSEEIEMDPEPYRNFYCYRLKVGTRFTEFAGKIELWLSAVNMYDNYIFKSNETFVEIEPAKNISNYFPPEDLDQLDKLSAKVDLLEQKKADNLVFDEESKHLQLSSNGALIGDSVNLSSSVLSDGVIDFDKETAPGEDENEDGETAEVSDDVIRF